MTIPTLRYYNNQFEIEGIIFPNSIVKLTKPEYSIPDTVKDIYYQEYSGNNKITYLDNSVKELSNYESFYQEIILLATHFEFEHKENLFKQEQEVNNTSRPSINLKDLFKEGITKGEQEEYIELIKKNYPEILLTDEFYFNSLNKIKKGLLKESDWTQLPDVQLSLSEESKIKYIEYRQSLRELDKIKEPLLARIPLKPF